MKIEFIDESTVKLTESLNYESDRPKEKKQILRPEMVNLFTNKYPLYEVQEVSGPYKISNFRGLEGCKGTWILKVQKQIKATKKKPKPLLSKSKAPLLSKPKAKQEE